MEKDHLEVLLENIHGKFDLVLEGQEVLAGEIRELGRKTEERFDLVDFKIDTLNQKIDGVEHRLDQKIDGIEHRLDQKIDGVEQKLSAKLDAVAVELSAHRRDTEAHGKGWRVSEGE